MAGKGTTIERPVAGATIGDPSAFSQEDTSGLPPDLMPGADTPEASADGATDAPAKEESESSRLKYLRRAALDFGQFDECAIVKVGGTRYVAAVREGENPVLLSQPSDIYRAIYG